MLESAVTMLFVPGNRPDRFDKAHATGADVVLLDLEDAVPRDDKESARGHVRQYLAGGGGGVIRVNAVGTPWHEEDQILAAEAGCPVMLPKAEDPAEITAVLAALAPNSGVIALIETARGVLAAAEVCAVPGVVRVALGNADLAAELGVDPSDYASLVLARQHLVLAAAASRIAPPVDGVTTAVGDELEVLADARRGASLGFSGKLCFHPSQVDPVRAAFRPGADALEWARKVVDTPGDGARVVDGRMIDEPLVRRARALLARAGSE